MLEIVLCDYTQIDLGTISRNGMLISLKSKGIVSSRGKYNMSCKEIAMNVHR